MEINEQKVSEALSKPGKLKKIILVLICVWLAFASIDKIVDVKNKTLNAYPTNTLPITSEGRVEAVPDMATVSLGFQTEKPTAEEAKNDISANINKLTEFLKKEGIDPKDIQSDNFNIYPQPQPPIFTPDGRPLSSPPKNTYFGNANVQVKVKNLKEKREVLSKVVSGAVTNGANQVFGVTMGFEDPEQGKQEARKIAIQKAQERAKELAQLSGLRIGKIVNITDNSAPGPYYDSGYGGPALGMIEKSISPNFEPGTQDIVVNMTVVFEIK